MRIEPYLFYDGNCEEAVEFYRQALGAEVIALMRMKEAPPGTGDFTGMEEKIMHAAFRIGQTVVMASDDPHGHPRFGGFSLSIATTDAAEVRRMFDALAQGGQVRMPVAETFWSPAFGMVEDRFGVSWMVSVLDDQCPQEN